jgi:hypothetical protein
MENGLWLLAAIAVAYACALAAGPLLRLRSSFAVPAISLAVPAVLARPLLIPADKIVYRAVSGLFSTDLMFRMVDYFRHLFFHGAYKVFPFVYVSESWLP